MRLAVLTGGGRVQELSLETARTMHVPEHLEHGGDAGSPQKSPERRL